MLYHCLLKRKSKRVLKLWEDITPEMMTEEETGSDNKFFRHRQSWRTRKFNRFMDRIDNYKTSTSSLGKQRVLGNEIDRLAPRCIAKHMINPTISLVWSTTKPIAAFSCTPRVQEVHTKAEVVHLTPGLLGLGVLFNCHE